ncbi:MAG: hypothetical protein RMK20_02915, partial [Verrucomicrobiales bacterium]|nr:hypothetical protein [Verrucomicrobiales bacterium]
SGSSNAPIRIGLDAANTNHNGPVIFEYDHLGDYANVSALLCLRDYVTFDGNVNGARHLVFRNLRNVTNGMGAECIVADGTRGVVVDHVAFTNCNLPIRLIYGTQFRVSHCEFRAVRGEAAIAAAACSGDWDANLIYSNVFEMLFNTNAPAGAPEPYFGPDGIQCGDGVSIFGNVFHEIAVTDRYTSTQHPDFIQTVGNFTKIYNNEFINIGDSAVDRGLYSGSVVDGVWIYNNVFRIVERIDSFPEFIRIYNGRPTLIRDVRICNNTFVDNPDWMSIWFSNYGVPVAVSNTIQNNIFYQCGGGRFRPVIHFDDTCAFTTNSFDFDANIYVGASNLQAYITYGQVFPASVWTRTFERRGKTNAPAFRFYSPFHPTNDLRLADTDTAAAGAGADLSAWFQTDKDGILRPSGAPWSIGAYEHPGGAPIVTSAPPEVSPITASEPDADPLAPGLQVLPGTTVQYSGQASGGPALSWQWLYSRDEGPDVVHQSGVGAVTPATFTYGSNLVGSGFVWKLRAHNGPLWAESQLPVQVIASPREPTNGVFEAELGAITAPFFVEDGAVGQAVHSGLSDGGRATYAFSVEKSGDYMIRARVNAPFFQERTVYVNVDGEPAEPGMAWPIPITTGFQERTVSWLGDGTCIDPQFSPKVFRLDAGTHQLIVRGQEPNVRLDRFSVVLVLPEVLTLGSSNSLGTSVFVFGEVNPLGTETWAYFEYGLTPEYGATTTLTNVGSGGEPVELAMRLSGLAPGAVHHYRLVAFNANGTNYGANRVFLSGTPRLRAAMLQDGRFAVTVSTASNWVYFLQRQTSLNKNAWLTLTNGRGHGGLLTLVDAQPPAGASFYRVLAGPLPLVESRPASPLLDQFVLLSGRVNPLGLPASACFEYGATTNYGMRTAPWELSANQGATVISNLLTGLIAEKLYHFRLVAWNANGTNWSDDRTLLLSPLLMQSVSLESGMFSVQIATRTNRWYWLEYTTNLSQPVWLSVTGFAGDGSLRTLTHGVGTDPCRFYRVRAVIQSP